MPKIGLFRLSSGDSYGREPQTWQTELMLQVTWCSRLVRINPPQSIPVNTLHQLCPIKPPIAPGISQPSRNQTQNQRSMKFKIGSAIRSLTLRAHSGGS